MKLKVIVAALVAIAAAAHLGFRAAETPAPARVAEAPQLSTELVQALSRHLAAVQESVPRPGESAVFSVRAITLDGAALATKQQFDRLRALPAGEAAVELSRKLESEIDAQNIAAYLQALLSTDHPAVERVAIGALARVADARTLVDLAGHYGSVAPELRGRILQVLEASENAAAAPGLIAIVDSDTDEKRSPVMMSALYGIANTGSSESVQYLLGQLTTGNVDYALMALERVRSAQGVEMIRAAAEGNKDVSPAAADFQPALRRIAENAAITESASVTGRAAITESASVTGRAAVTESPSATESTERR